jgi:hypothetical protein
VIVEPGIIVTPILEKALRNLPLNQASPYLDVARRVQTMFSEGQKKNGQPQAVAEVIENAIAAKNGKLRYAAGADAAPLLAGRARMSDEEWVAMERTPQTKLTSLSLLPGFPTFLNTAAIRLFFLLFASVGSEPDKSPQYDTDA